jgi:hypothetical protein
VYQERLYGGGQEYASPVVAGGKIYMFSRRSGAFVLATGPKFEKLHEQSLGDSSDFNASPAVSQGQLFVRSNQYLYCIGKKQ